MQFWTVSHNFENIWSVLFIEYFFLSLSHVLTDMTSEVVFILNVVISILISNSALSLMKQKAG